jgi:hypothetical protein
VDTDEEICTRISGGVFIDYIKLSGDGLFKRLELWDNHWESYIHIKGFKKPFFPIFKSYFTVEPNHLIADRFIGLTNEIYDPIPFVFVQGIAFGNIEWSY